LLSQDTEEGSETTIRIQGMLEQVFRDINSKVEIKLKMKSHKVTHWRKSRAPADIGSGAPMVNSVD
jgi:hypothetical protein